MPGKPEESLLLKALRWAREDLHMPPKSKLPPEIIADFEKWIAMGAPDPRQDAPAARKSPSAIDLEQGRKFWAFQPPRRHPVPRALRIASLAAQRPAKCCVACLRARQ